MKVTSLRYLDAKFHHPSLGASPPLRRTVFACFQNCYNSCISSSRSALRYDSINSNLMNYSWTNGRLAIPALAGLLVLITHVFKMSKLLCVIFFYLFTYLFCWQYQKAWLLKDTSSQTKWPQFLATLYLLNSRRSCSIVDLSSSSSSLCIVIQNTGWFKKWNHFCFLTFLKKPRFICVIIALIEKKINTQINK